MSEYDLGRHEAAIESLSREVAQTRTDVAAIRVDVAEVKEMLAERRGERRVAVWAAGGIGSIATLGLSTALEFLKARLGF